MSDERESKPTPGTWGALTRSTTPWPWRYFLTVATFTEREFIEEGPQVVLRKGLALLDAVREWEKGQ